MALTEEHVKLILQNPLDDTLNQFRGKLQDFDKTDDTARGCRKPSGSSDSIASSI